MTVVFNPFTGMFDIIRGNFNINASAIIEVIGDHTVDTNESFLKVDGTVTISLYTAVRNGGRIVVVKNIGNGFVTIDPFGEQRIDDDLEKVIVTQWTSLSLITDGANWFIL